VKNFIVYKSSAGSGKTFTLVKEYLRLALHDEKKLASNFRRILAVTFTNKAAAEMKSRVIDALAQISKPEKETIIGGLLCKELNLDIKELRKRANFVLGQILHHYSDLSIGTIDSFTHKIVKTFAHDLKLPVNFNIELDTNGFYEKVIALLFNKIGEDEYVSKLLKEYALSKAQDNNAWDPEGHIHEFSKLLQKENSGDYIDRLKKFDAHQLEEFRTQFVDFIRHYRDTLRSEAKKGLDLIKSEGLQDNDFIFKGSGPQKFFNKCYDLKVTLADASGSRIMEAIEKNKWCGKDSPESERLIKKICPQLNKIAWDLIHFIRENYAYYSLCELLSRQMYPLMLLKKIEEISEEQKLEEHLVFISEFNQKIFDIINNEPTPFIYERLGDRYQHYLLDEFQDTSSLQWQNILPLLDNSLSNGWFNLIVGDGKQSIYRWRNANVKQFASLPEVENPSENAIVTERAYALQRNFKEELLNKNFRSAKNIISFNNSFFDPLSHQLLTERHAAIYRDHAQSAENVANGYITIETGKAERDSFDEITCGLIKEHILQALASGFQNKDICILCRKNYHGNVVANYLITHGIQVVSSDSLLLRNNLEINTIICYLKYLVNKEDVISATAVVNYLQQSGQIAKEHFHSYISELSKGVSLFQILKKCGVSIDENELSLNNLFDNSIEVIRSLQLNRHGYHYVRFFLDEVNEYLVLKNSNIASFFDWWDVRSNKASMIIPENTNAVRIMTIHASKGLEFPVVIVPYCNWSIYQAGDAWVNVQNEKVKLPVSVINLSKKVSDSGFEKELESEQQEQLLDNLNLLYVAFTRAVERLHIISKAASTNKLPSVADWLDAFLQKNHKPSSPDFYEIGRPELNLGKTSNSGLPDYLLEPLTFSTPKEIVKIKASYRLNTDEAEKAKHQGLLMHWLLSKIKTFEDIDAAIESAVLAGELRESEVPGTRTKLAELCELPALKAYFSKGLAVRLEAELATTNGEILRPDRIIFGKEETILIDYKTGRENNKVYALQLMKYESALQTMGYPDIKKFLVYIDELKVVPVN
jgi:ATP-dependent exoDNAse (exonuclease V) beta subunit